MATAPAASPAPPAPSERPAAPSTRLALAISGRAERLEGSSAAVRAEFMPQSWDPETQEIDAVFYSGEWVDRWNYRDDHYRLRLSLEPGAVRLDRLNAGAPVLDNHWNFSTSDTIGSVKPMTARLEERGLVGRLRFTRRPERAGTVMDVADGHLRGVSVGIAIHKVQITQHEGKPDEHVALDWEPFEVSVAPIQADPNAAMLSAQLPPSGPAGEFLEAPMSVPAAAPATTTAAEAPPKPDTEALRREAALAERERGDAIRRAATTLGLDETHEKVKACLADVDLSAEKAALKLLELAHAEENKHPISSEVRIPSGGDQRDKLREQFGHVVGYHLGERDEKLDRETSYLARKRLEDILADHIRSRGERVETMGRMEIIRVALTHSRSDFPEVLGTGLNRSLMKGYEAEDLWFPEVGTRVDLPDMKPVKRHNLSDLEFKQVLEGKDYQLQAISETYESWSLLKYGTGINLTFETILDDNLMAFARLLQRAGGAGARLENAVVAALLTSTANLSDNLPLFHDDRGNIIMSGGPPGTGELGKLRKGLRQIEYAPGKRANLRLAHVILPVDLETAWDQLISPLLVPSQTSAVVPATMRSISAHLAADLASPLIWYGVASPNQVDTFEFGGLKGEPTIAVSRDSDPSRDTITWYLRHFFGAKWINARSIIRNPGA